MQSHVRLPDPEKPSDIISAEEYKINCDSTAENFKASFLGKLTEEENKFETDILISMLNETIQYSISLNKNQLPAPPTCFSSTEIPPISVQDYLTRLVRYLNATTPELAVMFIYLSRYQSANPNNLITELNIHRLLITALRLAQKFHTDNVYPNIYAAKVGGIPLQEMNNLEIQFLTAIDYDLYVSSEEYNQWKNVINYSELFKETTKRSATAINPVAHYHFNFSFFTPHKPAAAPNSKTDMVDIPLEKINLSA